MRIGIARNDRNMFDKESQTPKKDNSIKNQTHQQTSFFRVRCVGYRIVLTIAVDERAVVSLVKFGFLGGGFAIRSLHEEVVFAEGAFPDTGIQ